jgi:phage terminase small subunit
MKQRGRKSAENLAVMPIETMRHQLRPPDHLSASEQALFREVLANVPANQFSFADVYLLATFCQITTLLREQADRARKARPENRASEFKLLFEATKAQSLIATKLRLTTTSRTAAHVISRAHDKHRPSAYDMLDWTDDGVKQA